MKDGKCFFDGSMIRFIIVGVINTVIGSAIMFGMYNFLHISYWISTASNYILVSVLSYFLNKYFTFKNNEKSRSQVVRFAVNIVICYLIAYGLAKPLILMILRGASERFRINAAMFTGMVFFTVCNYLGQRFFAFSKKA